MNQSKNVSFVPQLYIRNGVQDIAFYTKALGAVELQRWTNEDGSVHVAELSIQGAVFQLHETPVSGSFDPEKHMGTTVVIGLFVEDVDTIMNNARDAGAVECSPAQDYDYGYRQGTFMDPFGHQWMIQKLL